MAGARRLAEIAVVRCRVGLVGAMVALLLVTIGALGATTTAAGSLVDGEVALPVEAADLQVSGERLALRGGTTEALYEYDDRSNLARASARSDDYRLAPQATRNDYSVAFETQLDDAVLGSSRSVHFNRANAALDDALRSDTAFATQFD